MGTTDADVWTTDTTGRDNNDVIRNAIVATVIGVGSVGTMFLLVILALLHCYFTKDKGQ